MAFWAVVLILGVFTFQTVGAQGCPSKPYKSYVNGTLCDNMTKHKTATSIEECAKLCCADPDCVVYDWCLNPSCGGWGGARCHTGTASNASCPAKTNWVGQSILPPPPTPAPQPPASRKRGFSGFVGENFTCDDAAALGFQDSWFYNWQHVASQHDKCKGQTLAREFVPMLIGLKVADSLSGQWRAEWKAANAHFLLGYNEPDYGNGHNHPHMCHPADAAKDWPAVQKVAASFDPPLRLVSPAVSTTGLNADGASQWLDQFFGNCSQIVEECDPDLIEFVAFHDYVGDAEKLIKRVDGVATRYNRPVWLTEFAILKWGNPPPREQQNAYMKEVMPLLEKNKNVFRYVWFSARNKPNEMNGGSNLLPWDSTSTKPTSTGIIYST